MEPESTGVVELLHAIARVREALSESRRLLERHDAQAQPSVTMDCREYDSPGGRGVFLDLWLEYTPPSGRARSWEIELVTRNRAWEVSASLSEDAEGGQRVVEDLVEESTGDLARAIALLDRAADAVAASVGRFCGERPRE